MKGRGLPPGPIHSLAWGLFALGSAMFVISLALAQSAGADNPGGGTSLYLGAICMLGAGLLPTLYDFLRLRDARLDRALLAMELADLLDAQIPLPEALAALNRCCRGRMQTRWTSMAMALKLVSEEVDRGTSLAQAVARSGRFPQAWEALLAHASQPTLASALRRLARLESGRRDLTQELTRPLVAIASVALVLSVAGFLATYILPTFRTMLEAMEVPLPWSSRAILLTRYLWFVPLLVFLAFGLT